MMLCIMLLITYIFVEFRLLLLAANMIYFVPIPPSTLYLQIHDNQLAEIGCKSNNILQSIVILCITIAATQSITSTNVGVEFVQPLTSTNTSTKIQNM